MQLRPPPASIIGRDVTIRTAHGVRVTVDTGAKLPRTTHLPPTGGPRKPGA